jgi:hypothetical protein
MNKRETYEMGRDRGLCFAGIDVTEKQQKQIDDVENLSSQELNKLQDDLHSAAGDAQDNDRQMSPFEFLAHEINECPNSEGLWEAFSDGIAMGIKKGFKDRFPEVFCAGKRRR